MLTNNKTIKEIKKICIKEVVRDKLISIKNLLYYVLLVGPLGVSALAVYIDRVGGDVKPIILGAILTWLVLATARYFLPDKDYQHDRLFTSKVACLTTCYLKEKATSFGLTNVKLKETKAETKRGKQQVGVKVNLSTKDKTQNNDSFYKAASNDVEILSKQLGKIYPIAINLY